MRARRTGRRRSAARQRRVCRTGRRAWAGARGVEGPAVLLLGAERPRWIRDLRQHRGPKAGLDEQLLLGLELSGLAPARSAEELPHVRGQLQGAAPADCADARVL